MLSLLCAMSLEMLKPSEDAWQVGANAETFSRGLPLQPIDVLAKESGATNGGTPPSTYVPAVKTELLKRSKSTGVQNVIGSGVFRTSYEVEMPLAKAGFYAGVRKHIQGLIDNWYGKKQAGKLTVTLPLRQHNFCSVQVNRYYDDGSASLSSSSAEGYLLAWNGKGLSKSEFEDSVLPGAMKGIESRIFGSTFIYPYDKRPYAGEVTKEGIHALVPYPDSLRVFFDADHARGRYVTADVSYTVISDAVKPNSIFGRYLTLRRFGQQKLETAKIGSVETKTVGYAPIPAGFVRQTFDHPWPWEVWNGPDDTEIWRSTVRLKDADAQRKKLLKHLELDAVVFKKTRIRKGKAGFGEVLTNYTARYSEESSYPQDNLAVWIGRNSGFERVIVTSYSETVRRKHAGMLTQQLALEAKQFLKK